MYKNKLKSNCFNRTKATSGFALLERHSSGNIQQTIGVWSSVLKMELWDQGKRKSSNSVEDSNKNKMKVVQENALDFKSIVVE